MDQREKAVIGKVIAIKNDNVEVDIGGVIIKVLSFEDVKVGDYVIVHEGFIIKVIDLKHAMDHIKKLALEK